MLSTLPMEAENVTNILREIAKFKKRKTVLVFVYKVCLGRANSGNT